MLLRRYDTTTLKLCIHERLQKLDPSRTQADGRRLWLEMQGRMHWEGADGQSPSYSMGTPWRSMARTCPSLTMYAST